MASKTLHRLSYLMTLAPGSQATPQLAATAPVSQTSALKTSALALLAAGEATEVLVLRGTRAGPVVWYHKAQTVAATPEATIALPAAEIAPPDFDLASEPDLEPAPKPKPKTQPSKA